MRNHPVWKILGPGRCRDKRYRAYDVQNIKTGEIKTRMAHRAIAENQLGRILAPNETVHHMDGCGTNNSPSNLMVIEKTSHEILHNLDEVNVEQIKGKKIRDRVKKGIPKSEQPINGINIEQLRNVFSADKLGITIV